jgi:hypothetical protein
MWKDEFERRYFNQASSSTQCLNCVAKDNKIDELEARNKLLMTRIKMLEMELELARKHEDHACQSGARLYDILNEMNNLHMS